MFWKRPTHRDALEDVGFKLVSEETSPSRSNLGSVTTSRYVKTSNPSWNAGGIVRPVEHHVVVDEFDKDPGKYNVGYRVTQDGDDFQQGDYNTSRVHKDNSLTRGVSDPIKDIIDHHIATSESLGRRVAPKSVLVNQHNVGNLVPSGNEWPGDGQIISYSSADDAPLDMEIARRLKNVGFEHGGRFPGESGLDLYYATVPLSPTFNAEFTVRHRPDAEQPFSYSAKRVQSGVNDDGSIDRGSFMDVTGDTSPVANFDTVNKLIRRHNEMKDALGVKRKGRTASESFYRSRLMEQADEDLRP